MPAPVVNSTHVLVNDCEDGTEFASAAGGTFGGASIITTYDVTQAAGYGWLPTNPAIRCNRAGGILDNELGGTMLDDAAEFRGVSSIDGSSAAEAGKRLFYTHHYSSQGSALNNAFAVGDTGYGYIFWLFSASNTTDRTANCRGWCNGGSDTIPTLFAPTPTSFMAFDPEHIATEVETGTGTSLTHIDVTTAGNEFDPENIESAAWTTKGGGGFIQTFSRFGHYGAYTAYEGTEATPGTFADFYAQTQSEQHYAVALGGSAQYRIRCALEFGDAALANTQPCYFVDANVSINFEGAPTSLTAPLVRPYHAGDNKIGIEQKFRSGDTFRLTNCQLSSTTPWHFRMASTAGATVSFVDCILQNAGGTDDDCELDSDVTIDGGLIDQFGKLAVKGGTIRNASVTDPANGTALLVTTASTLENVAISSTTATDYAIEMAAAGTYTIDNVAYSGLVYDVHVSASSGTVTINVTGGGASPNWITGTQTAETPALLGSGWVAGTSYTAVAGGGDTKRAIVVVCSNNGSKLPTALTIGGVAMNLAASHLQDVIGLSIWTLNERDNGAAFSGAQTISGTYSGGDPTAITYQAATYDHIRQAYPVQSTATDGNTASSSGVSTLDALSGQEPATYTISAGTNRALVVFASTEDNSGIGTSRTTSVTYGGQALTEVVQIDTTNQNSAAIFILNEAGIVAATSTTLSVTADADDGARFRCVSLENVEQGAASIDSVRESGSDSNADPLDVATLDINDGDYVIGVYGSTGGNQTVSWGGTALVNADVLFTDRPTDDTFEVAADTYSGSDTTTGNVSCDHSGTQTARTMMVAAAVKSDNASAGAYSEVVATTDEDLLIGAVQFSAVENVTWTGDATERLETDRAAETVSVADYVETATGTATMSISTTDATSGVDGQLVVARLAPSVSTTGGATVVVQNLVTVSVTVSSAKTLLPLANARVLLLAAAGGALPVDATVTITRVSTTATVAHTAHGMASGNKVEITGADTIEYRGVKTITVVDANSYTYTVSGTPTTPATGTIKATAVIVEGLTNGSGVVTNASFNLLSGTQPAIGKARLSSSAPYYRSGLASGTITSAGLASEVFLVLDE